MRRIHAGIQPAGNAVTQAIARVVAQADALQRGQQQGVVKGHHAALPDGAEGFHDAGRAVAPGIPTGLVACTHRPPQRLRMPFKGAGARSNKGQRSLQRADNLLAGVLPGMPRQHPCHPCRAMRQAKFTAGAQAAVRPLGPWPTAAAAVFPLRACAKQLRGLAGRMQIVRGAGDFVRSMQRVHPSRDAVAEIGHRRITQRLRQQRLARARVVGVL
jgi:hypothetical protein